MKLKRVCSHLVASLFAGLAVWWVFFFPYVPERLYGVIPYDAQVISEHEAPAERLHQLSRNPAVQKALADLGIGAEQVESFLAGPKTAALARHLAGRKVLFASVDRFGPAYRPTRVVASWIGWRTHFVRLALMFRLVPGFKRLDVRSSAPIWACALGEGQDASVLAAAAFEGVLVATISDDPLPMVDLLSRAYGGAARKPRLIYHLDVSADEPDDRPADCAWISRTIGKGARRARLVMALGLDTVSDSEIAGTARLVYAPPASSHRSASEELTLMRQTLGMRPQAELVCPLSYLQPLLAHSRSTWWERFAFETLTKTMPRDPCLGLSLITGEYRGRIPVLNVADAERFLSIAVPTLILCVPVDETVQPDELLRATLDRINAERKRSLIPHELPDTPFAMYVIDDVSDNAYGRMPREQKIAVAVLGDRLLVCSNLKVARQLLVEHAARDSTGAGNLASSLAEPGYVRFDLEATCLDIARVLTYCQMFASPEARRGLASATEWVKTMRAFENAELHLQTAGNQLLVRFRLGPE